MNKIYDNGYQMLGTVKNMKKYINKCTKYNIDEGEEHNELDDMLEEIKELEEIEEYSDENVIIMIDYDRPMGFGLYVFTKNDEMEND